MLDYIENGLVVADCEDIAEPCAECGRESVVEVVAAADGGDAYLVGAAYCEECW